MGGQGGIGGWLALVLVLVLAGPLRGAEVPAYRIAWSGYVGWVPWGYAEETGIMAGAAARHGLRVRLVRMTYAESLEAYAAGHVHGVAVTAMDALVLAAEGGMSSTVAVVGGYSRGNDAIIARWLTGLEGLEGARVGLVTGSVSHYLLARALAGAGVPPDSLRLVPLDERGIEDAFVEGRIDAAVTWNPVAARLAAVPGARTLFDSAELPGEILDLMVIDSALARQEPRLVPVLREAWYTALAHLAAEGAEGRAAHARMAALAATDPASFAEQLYTTRLFMHPADAAAFARAPDLPPLLFRVARFLDQAGIAGTERDGRLVGIRYPGGRVVGDSDRIGLSFAD